VTGRDSGPGWEAAQRAGDFLVLPDRTNAGCFKCGWAFAAHTGTGPCPRFVPSLAGRLRAAFEIIWWPR
jgi:hypothetical protein